jgi:hypothetical protein
MAELIYIHLTLESEQTELIAPTSGFIQSIFIISLTMWFIVETMKINWTGSEKAHHKDHIGSLQTTPFCKYEQNNNTIPNNDMIYLRYTK